MDDEHKKEHPEQAAALQKGRDEEAQEEEHPQDETDNALLDSEEHSDAPGPFGTG